MVKRCLEFLFTLNVVHLKHSAEACTYKTLAVLFFLCVSCETICRCAYIPSPTQENIKKTLHQRSTTGQKLHRVFCFIDLFSHFPIKWFVRLSLNCVFSAFELHDWLLTGADLVLEAGLTLLQQHSPGSVQLLS